ncbi:hypothetical protein ACLKA7_001375 [Drosophila subpalustris]
MKAAPAPSEAIAAASEDLPPRKLSRLFPAASVSSVCPEDLANLTLDPAAVEKMDQPQAMSSQKFHEEFEGADVILTPCNDEGNSRPPSLCDMEPLL